MTQGKCVDCIFFDEYDEACESQPAWGTCNRYPPVLFNKQAQNTLSSDLADEMAMMWKQPGVVGDDWCGEFKPCANDAPTDAPTIGISGG